MIITNLRTLSFILSFCPSLSIEIYYQLVETTVLLYHVSILRYHYYKIMYLFITRLSSPVIFIFLYFTIIILVFLSDVIDTIILKLELQL